MRKSILSIFGVLGLLSANAQMNINLNLSHVWDGQVFNYGQQYLDGDGNIVEISRVQYYLSGFDLTHDQGQITNLSGTYILASANISSYSLGSANISSLEAIDFDLGVDSATNHSDPSLYPSGHPLALTVPSMHWGWSAGYRFLVIEGMVDADGNGTVETLFEFHVTNSDSYLTSVTSMPTSGTQNGSDIDIDLYVNIADWLKDVDLTTAGSNHGAQLVNGRVIGNTNPETVFSTSAPVGIEQAEKANHVFFDYSKPHSPVMYYKFPESRQVSLKITDINAKLVLQENKLSNEGNYFITEELPSGTYVAILTDENGKSVREKFVVTR